MREVREFYRGLWQELNWFGRATVFPLLVACFPVILFVCLGVKREEDA